MRTFRPALLVAQREAAGMTRDAAAYAIDVQPNQLRSWEEGWVALRDLDPYALGSLADLYGCRVDDFYAGHEPPLPIDAAVTG